MTKGPPNAAAGLLMLGTTTLVAVYTWGVLGGGPPTQATGVAEPNFRGIPTLQLFQTPEAAAVGVPWWYTKFEADWNVEKGLQFAKEQWEVPVGAVVLYYFGLVLAGTLLMKDREAYDLRWGLALWNWLLALFSIAGTLRTLPQLLLDLQFHGFRHTICAAPDAGWGVGATGMWVQLFIFSKLPELLDTAFIVLRKKKLIFLHWYHHITVLLYCWHAYATECGAGLYFVVMNYLVHALMYAYFAFSTLRLVPNWFPPIVITGLQIAQMFGGMFICAMSTYYGFLAGDGTPCQNDPFNLFLGGIMYLSYLVLFLEFAFGKYIGGESKKQKAV